MGPRLKFYLQAVALFCKHCAGATVAPAASREFFLDAFAYLDIVHDTGYFSVQFYENNGVKAVFIKHSEGYNYNFDKLEALEKFLIQQFNTDEPVHVAPAFGFISKVLQHIADTQNPYWFELMTYEPNAFQDVFKNSPVRGAHLHDYHVNSFTGLIFCAKHKCVDVTNTVYLLPFLLIVDFSYTIPAVISRLRFGFSAQKDCPEVCYNGSEYLNGKATFVKYYDRLHNKVLSDPNLFAVHKYNQGGK